jgi:hypothetical protein
MTSRVRVGDAIAAATSAVGVRPCGGCKRRKEKLNRAFDLSTVRSASGRPRDLPPAVPVRLASSLLVGVCALALRERLRHHDGLDGMGPEWRR